MKNTLTLIALILFTSIYCSAQPQHIGALINVQTEGAGTGNGIILGMEGQSVHNLSYFTFVNNLSITADKKGYLNSFGGALKLHSKVRYHLPIASDEGRTFIQAGFNASGVQYSGSGGYAKYGFQPTAGFGFDFTPPNQLLGIIASYQFNFKSPLHGQKSFTNAQGRVLDGWTWGQQGRVEISIPVNPTSNWIYLINATAGRTVYRRNPAVYGPALGAELHRYTVAEISFGIGKLY